VYHSDLLREELAESRFSRLGESQNKNSRLDVNIQGDGSNFLCVFRWLLEELLLFFLIREEVEAFTVDNSMLLRLCRIAQ
jgi:hypothetical protein